MNHVSPIPIKFETDSSAPTTPVVSPNADSELMVIDQRLGNLTARMDDLEKRLFTTVDDILKLLGETPKFQGVYSDPRPNNIQFS